MTRTRDSFAPREGLIQAAVIGHWKCLGLPGSLVAAIPNANAHGQPGLTPGLPDLLVISPQLGAVTGYIELKAGSGRPSKAQIAIGDLMRERGIPYAVTYGRDQPIRQLEAWGAVKPEARPKVHGSAGGKVGGPARAASLTPERRREIATMAIRARLARAGAPREIVLKRAERSEIELKAALARLGPP